MSQPIDFIWTITRGPGHRVAGRAFHLPEGASNTGCRYAWRVAPSPHVASNSRILVLALCFLAAPAAAQGPAEDRAARSIAAGCAACHGTNGVSAGGVPSLAGQSKADLVRKMQDYKAGRTPSTIMGQLAKGYSDEQIDLAAAYFAARKP